MSGLLIINKPANMPVHPSCTHFEDSLSNGVQYYFMKNNLKTLIRPVNRLDKDTSGLVIFAKNQYIQEILVNNITQKCYKAILVGNLENPSGTINAPIARKNNSIIEREVNFENGQKAITHYKLLKNYKEYCLVEFQLETGRTHQIRVHSKYISHPILGDSLYGTSSSLISRQALHCYKIELIHPITQKIMQFEAQLPKDMQVLLKFIPKNKLF